MIKSKKWGQSPGDGGDSLRETRECRNASYEHSQCRSSECNDEGDVPEGSPPQESDFKPSGRYLIYETELSELEQKSDSLDRQYIYTQISKLEKEVVAEIRCACLPADNPETKWLVSLLVRLAGVRFVQGDWLAFRMSVEAKWVRRLRRFYKQGRLAGVGWRKLELIVKRATFLTTTELICSDDEIIAIAKKMSELNWRPL